MISKKKRTALYESIHSDIMDIRIKIARLTNGTKVGNDIDDLLYKFHIDCPEKAIRIFETETKATRKK